MEQINYIVVFLEGIFSFLSPCVLPILPVYLAVLSKSVNEDIMRKRSVLIRNTFLFILGISTAFFILGTGISVFRVFLNTYMKWILIVGGLMIVGLGLFSIGDLKIPFLQRERRFHYQIKEMRPWTAYLLGFTFSFGWTPCIGPMLASVLVLASTRHAVEGNILLLLYTAGFTVPFLLIALFSEKMINLLDKLKKHMGKIQKIGGFILIVMGLLMFTKGITMPEYVQPSNEQQGSEKSQQIPMAPDFTLVDQYGQEHTLSDYKGKVVFINFWATWCPPCKAELPDIEEIYREYGMNKEDVVILGMTFPNMDREKSKEEIIEFIEEEGYTFPTLFDESMELAYKYYISAFPTTFLINKDGTVEGYASGMLTKETMKEIIEKLR
ncbi:MAG: redoxin domain-containing protein [Clostridiales bacterium]|jgi:cytochrome c-type biogenesis protein|nr:redoxin domain-containing protein [Clostridiales bacterium]